MCKKPFITIFFVGVFFFLNIALAATSPVETLENTANQLIHDLKKNKHQINKEPDIVYHIVKRIILPRVDRMRMARSVVGRDMWQRASSAQRDQFILQFQQLVLRTYSGAFAEYQNETVKFHKLRGSNANAMSVTVQSEIIRPGKPSIPVDYSLSRKGDAWKIYDFTVDGISMVNSFRSQFASLNSDNLPALTSYLTKHLRKVTSKQS